VALEPYATPHDLPPKITQRRNPRLRIPDPLPPLPNPHALLLLNINALVPRRHMQRHLLLPVTQELGFHDTIWDQEQTWYSEEAGRHSLDDEQKAPGRHGAFDLRNSVREGAAEEDAVAETDFFHAGRRS
jgi:hypothetical protein